MPYFGYKYCYATSIAVQCVVVVVVVVVAVAAVASVCCCCCRCCCCYLYCCCCCCCFSCYCCRALLRAWMACGCRRSMNPHAPPLPSRAFPSSSTRTTRTPGRGGDRGYRHLHALLRPGSVAKVWLPRVRHADRGQLHPEAARPILRAPPHGRRSQGDTGARTGPPGSCLAGTVLRGWVAEVVERISPVVRERLAQRERRKLGT